MPLPDVAPMVYSQSCFPVSSTLECPDCGKHSIVQHQETRYICLSCNWEKDLSKPVPPPPKPKLFSLPFWLGTGALLLLML